MTLKVVLDASCLIDLRKGRLLGKLARLDAKFVVPIPVREQEVLCFEDSDWRQLDDGGVVNHDLPPDEVGQALALQAACRSLSACDCFCIVTARARSGLLLTGDARLRQVAGRQGLKVHGVLWVIDQLAASGTCRNEVLVEALETWRSDRRVFLPDRAISRRLRKLRADGHD